jgi:two-component system chemotaxis sensor kinase CheA
VAETDGIVREFLLESFENLEQADTDLVALETQPDDRSLLDRVFRVIHTIKGTCGFLGYSKLEGLTHAGESLLSILRDGKLAATAEITDVLLELVDGVRRILNAIEATGEEGEHDFGGLIDRLSRLRETPESEPTPVTAESSEPAEPAKATQPAKPAKAAKRRGRRSAPAASAEEPSEPVSAEEPLPVAAEEAPTPDEVMQELETSLLDDERNLEADEPVPAADESAPGDSTRDAGVVAVSESNVRVDVRILDRLMDLVGELVLTRNELLRQTAEELGGGAISALQHLNLVTSDLQEGIMKTRMQPVGKIWGKFPRLVRDLASACGKRVRLEMEGQDTELDRSLIEAIRDPLTHLVRNAIDHGLETPTDRKALGKPLVGRLWLRAFPEGGQVNIQISDDGRGIDPDQVKKRAMVQGLMSHEQAARMSVQEALNLIFLPGFSTAEAVTSLSGRGVGMDVVKTNIDRVNGLVDVESELGHGTTIKIKIPLTLAIIPALIVTSGAERFAIPQSSVLELMRLGAVELQSAIEMIHGAPVYRLRGRLLPIVELRRELELADVEADEEGEERAATIVVLQADERHFGLLVDGVIDSQEIVVKPLGGMLERIPVFVGATIMGDGRVALILDVLGLAQRAHVITEEHEKILGDETEGPAEKMEVAEQILLCRSPDDGRVAIPLAKVARLETLPASSIESVGQYSVVQYRGDILPLIDVYAHLPERRERPRASSPEEGAEAPPEEITDSMPEAVAKAISDAVSVVVYAYRDQQVGLIVDGIIDIVEEVVEVQRPGTRDGVSQCAVIRGRVTEFLDVEGILSKADQVLVGDRVEG